jgi:hypothetical protein
MSGRLIAGAPLQEPLCRESLCYREHFGTGSTYGSERWFGDGLRSSGYRACQKAGIDHGQHSHCSEKVRAVFGLSGRRAVSNLCTA